MSELPPVSPVRSAQRRASARAAGDADGARGKFLLPAWLISVLLHASLVVILGLTFTSVPQGVMAEAGREVGLVLKRMDQGEPEYDGADDVLQESTDLPNMSAAEAEALSPAPPVDPSSALPQAPLAIGAGSFDAAGLPSAAQMTAGGLPQRTPRKGQARTEVFGLAGEGSKFVYVFDRSGSMGGAGRSPLRAAKQELAASLESLEDTHQFHIIFYNEVPTAFQLPGQPGKLIFATPQNKQQARTFLDAITADGATRHEEALTMALRLNPDVVFFLTDADQPVLTPAQLQRMRQLNGGRTSINCIEFGLGPPLGGQNFLKQLAEQNGGGHVYVDITRLR